MIGAITVFKDIKDTTNPHYVTPESIIERIRTCKDKDKVDLVRAELDEKKKKILKGELPCICWSGKFSKRDDESITEHSGLVCLDFDHVKDVLDKKVEMSFLPFVYAAFVSPSGDGVKVIVRVPKEISNHRGYYMGLLKLFHELDTTSINVSRVCYSSYDPDIYFNPQSTEFKDYIAEKPEQPVYIQKKGAPIGTNYKKIDVAVNMIRCAIDGTKHHTLLKAAKLMGGYIAGGMVAEDEAIRILEFEISQKEVDDFDAAKQTIKAGIEHGKTIPLYEMEKDLVVQPSSRAIKPIDDVWEEMKHTFKHGKKRGETTHFTLFDNNFKWKAGEVTLIAARPNAGKTEFGLHLMLLKSVFCGWKWGVFSPENFPQDEFYDTLIHGYIGKTTDPYFGTAQMSFDEYERGYNFIREHFFYIYPERHTMDEIDAAFTYLIKEKGICGTFCDPYNQIEHQMGEREDLFLSKFLTDRKRFALKHQIYSVISTHPKSMTRNKNGDYEIPDMYDISGGAMWANKMDNIIVLHRPNFISDPKDTSVEIHVRKIKKQKLVGVPGLCAFTFERKTNRYYINDENPMEVKANANLKQIRNYSEPNRDEPPF